VFRRAVIQNLRAHTQAARAQTAVKGAERLPLEPINGKSRRMALADGVSSELPAPVLIMTLGASEVELTLPHREELAACLEMAGCGSVDRHRDGHSPGLIGDEGCKSQQLIRFIRERLRALPLASALVDPQLDVEQLAGGLIDHRVARRHAFHAGFSINMAAGTGLALRTRGRGPQLFTGGHPKHTRIGTLVCLLRAKGLRKKRRAGAPVLRPETFWNDLPAA